MLIIKKKKQVWLFEDFKIKFKKSDLMGSRESIGILFFYFFEFLYSKILTFTQTIHVSLNELIWE